MLSAIWNKIMPTDQKNNVAPDDDEIRRLWMTSTGRRRISLKQDHNNTAPRDPAGGVGL